MGVLIAYCIEVYAVAATLLGAVVALWAGVYLLVKLVSLL